jgi:hypothetical protein
MGDPFAERLEAVRLRFVTKFDARIEMIEAVMSQSDCEDGLNNLALAHREAHGLCGIGPTLGFVGTGKAARLIERILLAALKSERALTDDEIPRLLEGISLLRSTAAVEMRPAGLR